MLTLRQDRIWLIVKRMAKRKHGHNGLIRSPTYSSWAAMNARCNNPNNTQYGWYGARGIKVCTRWQGEHGFENFLADMGERPVGYSIERRDSNGNYEPSNCYWATLKQQHRNTRRNVIVTYQGKAQCLSAWAEEIGMPRSALAYRHKAGWSENAMFETPVQRLVT